MLVSAEYPPGAQEGMEPARQEFRRKMRGGMVAMAVESKEEQNREQQKLIARIRRIRGQVDAIERSLTEKEHCADTLMLLANVRGGINSLMAEVLEDHIRLHMVSPGKNPVASTELAEDLIDLVRAYLK